MWYDILLSNPFIKIFLIVAVATALHSISGKLVSSIVERSIRAHVHEHKSDYKKRADTISNIFGAMAGLLVWLVAVALILNVLHFNLASVAAGAGFLGIIIGLGAQATIRDYLAGIFILLENQYRVGDIVTLSGGTTGLGTSGVVEEITLRITKLRDLDGTLNVIRNGEASIITNRTFEYSSVVLDVGVTYDSDIDTVERVMNEIGTDIMNDAVFADDINEPIQFLRVDRFADSAVIVKAVGKVKPAKQWEIAGEYRRRLLKAFASEGVNIALPRLIVEQKQSK